MKIEQAGRYQRADGGVQVILCLSYVESVGRVLAGGMENGVMKLWCPVTGKPVLAGGPTKLNFKKLEGAILTAFLGDLRPGDNGFAALVPGARGPGPSAPQETTP